MASRYRLGFDIGGTFTDFVLHDLDQGTIHVHKVLTTPEQPEVAVLQGLLELLAEVQCDAADIEIAIHGTTLITNALIERHGSKTALLTTAGHRDVLEIGTEMRYDTYDLRMTLPEPLVPRPLRFDVRERLDASGQVLVPLSEDDVREAAHAAAEAGAEAIAISFLHSFRDSRHEHRAAALVREILPNASVAISSTVAPEIREYQRTSTTVANAYTQPISVRYFGRMIQGLRQEGYRQRLYVMLSSGSVATAESVQEFPIRVLESGPAGGVTATAFLGHELFQPRLIAFDMGGTTAKLSLLPQGQPIVTGEAEVARQQRFKPGSGLPIRVPMIEMIEIGAGGGSIARIDRLGLLKVGPQSAGAEPGPACYGLGGADPTVTDANLLLGYLDEDSFLGGRMRLDRAAAESALEALGRPLGLSSREAAQGVFRVVNENMISAAKVHVAERGQDSRRFVLVAFGGAGPIHAYALARALKIPRVIFPAAAGVLSAFGFLTAPIAFEYSRSFLTRLTGGSMPDLIEVFGSMEAEGRQTLLEAGVPEEAITFSRAADMRYLGQSRELNVPLPADSLDPTGSGAIERGFASAYERVYGHAHPDVPVQIVTCRLVARGPAPEVQMATVAWDPSSAQGAIKGRRNVWFDTPDAAGVTSTVVYDRYRMAAGVEIAGPAVVEERESTAVIPPGMRGSVDEHLNLSLSTQA